MFTFIALSACDGEIDGVVRELEEDSELVSEDAEAELSSDESLDFSLPPEPAADWECYNIQVQYRDEPSGLCGGCVIQGAYPGQKELTYARSCENNQWGPWEVILTRCEHC
ncbi:hypothetical protein [Nannocystis radixulma]|uniref:Uncharacterized protein n=1 Tax=Nannocystis radixulma TaxID=2995305 RepID=A0ABT5BG17_9BACT|nr:hypothetical protein [Nannocystis radixulma]MDC0672479.1 hypothetical protein [Nannocystis radixulma]